MREDAGASSRGKTTWLKASMEMEFESRKLYKLDRAEGPAQEIT